MLVKTFASAVHGVQAHTITIEVNMSGGGSDLRSFIVGLPDNAVKESWQRIETAVRHNGMRIPRMKFVFNLAPADVRKEGTGYDLPMAIGLLAASEQMPAIGSAPLMGCTLPSSDSSPIIK